MGIDPLGSSLHEVFPADACLVLEPTYRAVFDGVESQIEVPLGGRDWLITVSPLGRDGWARRRNRCHGTQAP